MTKETTTERCFIEAGVIDCFMALGGYRWKSVPLRKEVADVQQDRSAIRGDPPYSEECPWQRYIEIDGLKLSTFGCCCGDTTFTQLCNISEAEYAHLQQLGWQPDPRCGSGS